MSPDHWGGLAVVDHDRGSSGRPLVLLIHGTMDRAASFARTARRLEEFDVRAYDRRGYAGSLHLGASTDIRTHVADAEQVLGNRRALVVGHSFGGLVALALAAARPDYVAGVAAYEPPTGWILGQVPPPLVDITQAPGRVAQDFFRATVGDKAWQRLSPTERSRRLAEGPAIVADLEMAAAGPGIDPAALEQSLFVAHGDDPRRRYAVGARRLVEAVPTGRLDGFSGVGHGSHLSHPGRVASWITEIASTLR